MQRYKSKLPQAYAFAMACHDGQWYAVDHPYIWHVLDVARRVRPLGPRYEIVAVLHDTLEDTGASPEEIETLFGSEILAGVEAMTKYEGDRYFKDYMPRVIENDLAKVVKYADSTDNLDRTWLIDDPDYRLKKQKKFTRVLTTLRPLLPADTVLTIQSAMLP